MRTEHLDGHRAELEHFQAQLLLTRGIEVPEELAPTTHRDLLALMRS